MKKFLLNVTVIAVGLTLLSVVPIWAAEPSRHDSGRGGSMSGSHREFDHSYRPSERFDYRQHGFRSFSYTHYGWSDHYRCYCYYSPSYGWCFYVPTYSYYLPISYYSQVYPQSVPVVKEAPSVIQQTTVVATPSAPVPGLPTPPPVPPVAPGPTAVQKTNVGPGAP
jgi:hypothetical protein